MSFLAVKVREYVSQPGITALGLEKKASLPAATITHIMRDSHPRPERMGQLLRVLPDRIAREWLIAYLQDDIPDDWRPRIQIVIQELSDDSFNVCESESVYGPPPANVVWKRLESAMASDPDLTKWFINTVNLILGPP